MSNGRCSKKVVKEYIDGYRTDFHRTTSMPMKLLNTSAPYSGANLQRRWRDYFWLAHSTERKAKAR